MSISQNNNEVKITIRDIAKLVKWKDVRRAIKYYYPEDRNNYENVLRRLQNIQKRKAGEKGEEIEIFCGDYPSPIHYESVERELEDRYYTIHTNKYSMSFRLWSEVANIPISKTTLRSYMFEDILAHFIWEITYFGNEKSMKYFKRSINKSVKSIKN